MTRAEAVAFNVLHKLKGLTKQYPASNWNDEYRKLADLIHSGTRDFEHEIDLTNEMPTNGD